ncbi:MAG: hypothetical protein ABJL67_13460 [Sulfitobacter sp.]
MRPMSPALLAALEADAALPRDFMWITVRNRETGEPMSYGAWSDLGGNTVDVIDPATGDEISRTYRGIGGVLDVSPVALLSGLTVQTVTITLNHIDEDMELMLRGFDMRRAAIELHRGFLDPNTMRLIDAAVPRFSGFVDEAPLTTPAEGQEGVLTLICASHTQDLVRSNSAKRSDADQRRRNPTDGFFRHAATVGGWKITWGQSTE